MRSKRLRQKRTAGVFRTNVAHVPARSMGRQHLLQKLQRNAGNQMIQTLTTDRRLQTKLTVGPPNDIYEREADRVADAIMRMPAASLQRAPD